MHPIHRLPSEILSDIFIQCLPFYSHPDPSWAPLLLAAVGGDWRRVAIATPRLWSRIALQVDLASANSGSIRLFQCWLSRSRGCPLYIDLLFQKQASEYYTVLAPTGSASYPERVFLALGGYPLHVARRRS
ncbi:hypothetical protein FB45DRAFT_930423 [Roridomyces roridus]|uniref:F-box domain-containing protein n=1 Tax=Roridomyces roridus TaxID=1738132 RepID=A0AAD7BF97_9AGAR|nr:hypothetical protein FB45DRAFT_930423 [Roridomyces roridus]